MTSNADVYWEQYLASLPDDIERPPGYLEAFSFGFTPRDASEIADLQVPHIGDHSVVNNGSKDPVCIIRTTEVSIIPFDEMPEVYARDGGEGDRTLATWRPMYWRYIESECQRICREANKKTPLVMERFAVVYREAHRKRAEDAHLGERPR